MRRVAYLDNASTTRPSDAVVEAMRRCRQETYGNPSSIHAAGRAARKVIEDARESMARFLGVTPFEIVFTSGATEANNSVLLGRHIVTTAVEHPSVLEAAPHATIVGVDRTGRVNPDDVLAAIKPETELVSVMLANNEIGTLQPVAEIARRCRERGVLVHTDAVQALGKVPLDVRQLGVDFMSLSAHKVHGSKGTGALFARSSASWAPLLRGGGQEFGKRAGTENVAGIVGFACAVADAVQNLPQHVEHIGRLSKRLIEGLQSIPETMTHGHPTERVASIVSVSFAGVDAEKLGMALDAEGVYISSGSACASLSVEPSHVLCALKLDREVIRGAVRFSISWQTSGEEIDYALSVVPGVVARLRQRARVER